MKSATLLTLILCSSLAMADVVKISDDTFVIRRSDKAGIFGNTAKMRDEVLSEAEEFAAERGKSVETVNLSETGKGFMRFAKIEYTFRLVDAELPEMKEESADRYAELKKLAELRDQGIITEEEFQTEKRELLDSN